MSNWVVVSRDQISYLFIAELRDPRTKIAFVLYMLLIYERSEMLLTDFLYIRIYIV